VAAGSGEALSAPAGVAAPRIPPASALREETQLLESANGALAAGLPADALSRLDAYEARFPAGALAEDAGLLRVKAKLAGGDRPGALLAAAAFERCFPSSAYLPRIRAVLANAP
jgi:outer membrane protein assembly factor BamD (BamD/ComL family)